MADAPEAPDPSYWHPELLAGPLRSKRLTVLYGPPGPWRDGMVRRGLMPLLRRAPPAVRGRPRRRQVPIRFDGWGPLPLQALHTRIDAEFSAVWPHGTPETLAAHLRAIGRHHHATVLLVLDGFERHLQERAERHDIERFDVELSECITHEGVPVHVLIVVDELENRALQRYTRWIADFGNDFLRLPSLGPQNDDARTPWHDTDIQAPPEGADEAPVPPHGEGDWPVDLWLDLAPQSGIGATAAPPREPDAKPVAAPFAESEPAAWPDAEQLPEPTSAWPAAFDPERARPDGATGPDITLGRGGVPATERPAVAPGSRIEPVLFVDPPVADPPTPAPAARPATQPAVPAPPPAAPPAAPSGPAPFADWQARSAPAGPRTAPPWLSDADLEQMRRAQERAPRWPGLLGLALYMAVLLGGAWWVARWIIESQRVESRQRPIESMPAASAPAAAPAPTAAPAPPAVAPPPPPPGLAMVWPPDAGAAAPLIDELTRLVTTPAGIVLRAPAANEPPALTLMRTDALLAAHAAHTPLQVVAPLYTEQVQVLVRTDARWDYVHEIRGLRLNIGRADGARAATARALYQQLFGTTLPADQANELELDAALDAMQRRDAPFDAIVVVSETPLESQLQPAAQRQVRELAIDSRRLARLTALPAFSISRRTHEERARLSATTYLVAAGAPPRAHDALLRALATALCRAQPQLQKQASALLRGFKANQQPDVGYAYVLPRTREGTCPLS